MPDYRNIHELRQAEQSAPKANMQDPTPQSRKTPGTEARLGAQRIVMADVDIPMSRLIDLMVKLAIAAIPAMLILAVLWFFLVALMGGMVGTL